MHDLIIIGAGPAGLSAAIYASRAELDYILIEENFVNGGQIIDTYEIDNYPGLPGLSGMDLAQKMADHAEKLGAEVVNAAVEGLELEGEVKKVKTDEGTFEARAVIIASGAAHSHLGVPGEEELAGRGVSYCATCDGAFYRGKTTVVVGGGDVAVEDAIFLARGCEKVYVVHRRDELRAVKTLQTALFALPNVEMVWDSNLKSINEGTAENGKAGKAASVTVVNKYDKSERVIDAESPPAPVSWEQVWRQTPADISWRARPVRPAFPVFSPRAMCAPSSSARLSQPWQTARTRSPASRDI